MGGLPAIERVLVPALRDGALDHLKVTTENHGSAAALRSRLGNRKRSHTSAFSTDAFETDLAELFTALLAAARATARSWHPRSGARSRAAGLLRAAGASGTRHASLEPSALIYESAAELFGTDP